MAAETMRNPILKARIKIRSSFSAMLSLDCIRNLGNHACMTQVTVRRVDEELYFLREKGTPIPTNDIWIAAMVRETGGKLLTRDSHFECLPQVKLERERR
jgi:hypothetical protein